MFIGWNFNVFLWFQVGLFFCGSRWVFMVFHGSRLVFRSSRSVFMVFMVPCCFFIFHVENTLKLYSGPTILLGLAGRRPALA